MFTRVAQIAARVALTSVLTTFVIAPGSLNAAPKPPGGGAGGGAAASSGSGASAGPAAPSSPLASAFGSFYVVADGGDPLLNTYLTELVARKLGDIFRDPNLITKRGAVPLFFVAATGWTQDNLAASCQADSNAIGGVIVKYTSAYVDSNWLIYNAESEHVTPTLFLVACNGSSPALVATPPLNIFTVTSKSETTVPISPVAGIASLFTYKGSTSGPVQVNNNVLFLTTAIGNLSGNVGYSSQGHEALSVSKQLADDVADFVKIVCKGEFKTDQVDLLNPVLVPQLQSRFATLRIRQSQYYTSLNDQIPPNPPSSPTTAQGPTSPQLPKSPLETICVPIAGPLEK